MSEQIELTLLEKIEKAKDEINELWAQVAKIAQQAEMAHDSEDDPLDDTLWVAMVQTRDAKEAIGYAIENLSTAIEKLENFNI